MVSYNKQIKLTIQKSLAATNAVGVLTCLFIFLCLFPSTTSIAQLPWIETFNDNVDEGVTGSCGANATSCAYYNAPTDGTFSGNFDDLNNGNDWFYIYNIGGGFGNGIEARDVDREVCYTTNPITLGSATTVDVAVDFVEWGNLGNGDYISVSLIVDGIETLVQTVSNDFGTITIQANNITVTSTIAVKLCFDNNNGNKYQAANEIRIVEQCNAPVALCQNISVALDGSGNASITTADIDNGSTADCGLDIMTLSQSSFDCSDIGNNNITLTVFDDNGNTDNCNAIVTVTGPASPIASCQDITIDVNTTITAAQIDNGSSAPCGIASITLDQYTFTCADVGTNIVTLTVTDNIGDVSTCNATVTVNGAGTAGNFIPAITGCPSTIDINTDPGVNTALVSYTIPTANNTINDFNYDYEFCEWTIVEEAAGFLTSNAPTTITLSSTDDGTFFAQTSFEISIPCDVSISFDWNFETDDTFGEAGWDPFGYVLNGTFIQLMDGDVIDTSFLATGAPIQSGSETIILSAGDDFAFAQRTVDGIFGSGHTTISNFSAVEATAINRTAGLASGSNFPIGTTTVTHEAVDCEGNSTSCSFDVIVSSLDVSCEQVIINRHVGFKIRN